MLAEDFGFTTKEQFKQFIYDNSLMTVQEWLDSDQIQTFAIPHLEIPASTEEGRKTQDEIRARLDMPSETIIKRFRSPSQINIMVTGEGMIYFVSGGDLGLKSIVKIDPWR